MRVLDGMDVMTKPQVIALLRDYEQMRRWRRTKALFRWIARLFRRGTEGRSLADLSTQARQRVREELDRADGEMSQQEAAGE